MKHIKYVFFSLFIMGSACAWAQDIIVTRNSDRIDAKIVEVSESEVKYKKTSDTDGPTFVIESSKIATVIYANGDVQTFEQTSKNHNLRKGDYQRDRYYKGLEVNLTPTFVFADHSSGFTWGIGVGRRFSEKYYAGLNFRIGDFGETSQDATIFDNISFFFVVRPYYNLNSLPFDFMADIFLGYEHKAFNVGDLEYLSFRFIPGIEYPLTKSIDLRFGMGLGSSIVMTGVPGVSEGSTSASFLVQATFALHGKRTQK